MSRKRTLEEVKELYKLKNIEYLGGYISNTKKDKVSLQCMHCNYLWITCLGGLLYKNAGCPHCAGVVKYSHEQIKEMYLERNIRVDSVYVNAHSKNSLECLNCQHKWKATFHSFKTGGNGCPICSNFSRKENLKKYTYDEVKTSYEEQKISVLDNIYVSYSFKHNLQCNICSFKWKASFDKFKQGRGCPKCNHGVLPSIDEIRSIYLSKNIILLADIINKSKEKHAVKCSSCCYIWETTWDRVSKGKNCPYCNGGIKYTIERVRQIFKNKGFILLEDVYNGCSNKHSTKCLACNHIWDTIPAIIFRGSGCSKCSLRKNEKLTVNFLIECGINYTSKTINMADSNIQTKCVVDASFIVNNQEFFIEVQGEQHYEPVAFNGDKEAAQVRFERQVKRDEWLRNYCKTNNIILIEIDLRKYQGEQIKEYLREEFTKIGILTEG